MSFPFSTPVQQIAQHIGESSGAGRGLSPHLWQYLSKADFSPNGSDGSVKFHDDFTRAQGLTAPAGDLVFPNATTGGLDGYKAAVSLNSSVVRSSDVIGGGLELTTVATDNKLVGIGTGDLLQISTTADSDKMTIFEAVITLPAIAASAIAVGLGSNEGIVAAGLQTNGEYINVGGSFLGFRVLDATPTAIDFVYKAAGAATATVLITGLQTMVAGTQYKVGFVYDPAGPDSKKIRVFLDDTEQTADADYVTLANIQASTFPEDEYMGVVGIVKAGAATAKVLTLHEWACFQEG